MPRTLESAIEARSAAQSAAIDADGLECAGRLHLTLRRTARFTVQALVFIALISVFFFRVPQVDGRSMQPNIEGGNHVLINTLAYRVAIGPLVLSNRPISRGDIVAFEWGQGDDRKIFLKRVVALPGETVAISNGAVIVNGTALREAYDPMVDQSSMPPLAVPAGSVFVLGDNRAESDDSRSFGPVSQASIVGKALFIIWPLGHVQRIR